MMITMLMTTLLVAANSMSIQIGQWQSIKYKNDSSIFGLLSDDHGSARVQIGSRQNHNDQNLYIDLKGESSNHKLAMSILMKTGQFKNQAIFSLLQTNIDFTLYRGKKSSITYKFNQTLFNVTLIYRESIYVNSTDGDFVIKLIDFQDIFPDHLTELFVILASSLCLVGLALFYIQKQRDGPFTSILGQFAAQIILLWKIRVLIEIIFFQQYYVSFSGFNQVMNALGFIGIYIHIPLALYLIGKEFKQRMGHCPFKLRRCFKVIVEILFIIRLVFAFQDQLNLIYAFVLGAVYQILVLVCSKPNQYSIQQQIWVLHFALYLFPIAIFPYYHQQVNYPKAEADIWWAYILLYGFEVAVFYLKSNGGILLRFKYYLRRKQNRKVAYEQVREEGICAICLKPIEVEIANASDDSINAAGQNTKIVLHSCNHYFHEACINDIYPIQKCFFDNQRWYNQQQMKQRQSKANKK